MSSRCRACNNKLSDTELVRKIKSNITGKVEYVDLCSYCLSPETYAPTQEHREPLVEIDEE